MLIAAGNSVQSKDMTLVNKISIAGAVLVVAVIGVGAFLLHWRSQQATSYDGDLRKAVLFDGNEPAGPLQKAYEANVDTALAQDQPIMLLNGLKDDQVLAQQAAVSSAKMQQAAHDQTSGKALRSQVFQVYALPGSSASGDLARCASELHCNVVEVYFFADNQSGKSVVGVAKDGTATVLSESLTPHSQPELPPDLTDVTKEIIKNSKQLQKTLGGPVDIAKLTMTNGKTALNQTRCERSEHLCVAPTLAKDDEAVWIIVDMTDMRIAGVSWTDWKDEVAKVPPSEQSTIDKAIQQKYCGVDHSYSANGWSFSYDLTGSDGIEVKDVTYRGTPMIASVKNTDWHVSYSRQEGFGYSDAVGCPIFSTAAVVPATEPRIQDHKDANGNKDGFELVQDFKSKLWPQPCNYYYQQRFQFFGDGSFRPVVVNLGRGCGDDATYRPVTRIQPAPGFTGIQEWDGTAWKTVGKEKYDKDSESSPLPENDQQYRYRLSSGGKTLDVSLGRGQFGDGGHGDNAWIFLDRFHADKDEGTTDQATLGACCNTDYRQGPEVYTNDEPLGGAPVLLWYIAEQKNSAADGAQYCWADADVVGGVYKMQTYPCASGPKLTLMGAK